MRLLTSGADQSVGPTPDTQFKPVHTGPDRVPGPIRGREPVKWRPLGVKTMEETQASAATVASVAAAASVTESPATPVKAPATAKAPKAKAAAKPSPVATPARGAKGTRAAECAAALIKAGTELTLVDQHIKCLDGLIEGIGANMRSVATAAAKGKTKEERAGRAFPLMTMRGLYQARSLLSAYKAKKSSK